MTFIFIIELGISAKKNKEQKAMNMAISRAIYKGGLDFEIRMLKELIQDLNKHIDTLYNRQLKEKWTKKLVELEDEYEHSNPTK
jgi:hypothetical protein